MKTKRFDKMAILPTRAHEGDAGLDLYAPYTFSIASGERVTVDTAVGVQLPMGTYGKIEGRSSLAKKGITPLGGVIDESYRGPIGVVLANLGRERKIIQRGDRIAQLIVQPHLEVGVMEVDELDDTERGAGGFGSTGE